MPSNTIRPTIHEYYLRMLPMIASRATCGRRQVGCIITDDEGQVLATGYNGVPRHFVHCTFVPCEGAKDKPGNTDHCLAVHAEQNAIIQLQEHYRAHRMYVSNTPCFVCTKPILNTGIKEVYALKDYADPRGPALLKRGNIAFTLMTLANDPNQPQD